MFRGPVMEGSVKRLLAQIVPGRVKAAVRAIRSLRGGELELPLVALMCERGETSVDVGANVGVYTWFIQRASRYTVAVEPHPGLARKLHDSFGSSVAVMQCALSDHEGEVDLSVPLLGGNDLPSRATVEPNVNTEFERRTVRVPLRTLDSLNLSEVAFLKVHVEGHEYAVLQGGQGLLSRCHPTILVGSEERHVPGGRERITAFLAGLGYSGFFVHEGRLHPMSAFRTEVHQRPERAKGVGAAYSGAYIHNFIFVHPARARVLDRLHRRLGGPVQAEPLGEGVAA